MIRTNTDEPIDNAVKPDRRLIEQTGVIHGREGGNGGAQGTGMSIKYVRTWSVQNPGLADSATVSAAPRPASLLHVDSHAW